jgi:uncharacterized small protein (DUF1192 family)
MRRRRKDYGIPPEYDDRNFPKDRVESARETLLRMISLTDNPDRCAAFCRELERLDAREAAKSPRRVPRAV